MPSPDATLEIQTVAGDPVPTRVRVRGTWTFSGLKLHRESKEQPVYALVLAKSGHRMKENAATEDRSGRGDAEGRHVAAGDAHRDGVHCPEPGDADEQHGGWYTGQARRGLHGGRSSRSAHARSFAEAPASGSITTLAGMTTGLLSTTPIELVGPMRVPAQLLGDQTYDGHVSVHDGDAAAKLGTLVPRQQAATNYSEK